MIKLVLLVTKDKGCARPAVLGIDVRLFVDLRKTRIPILHLRLFKWSLTYNYTDNFSGQRR